IRGDGLLALRARGLADPDVRGGAAPRASPGHGDPLREQVAVALSDDHTAAPVAAGGALRDRDRPEDLVAVRVDAPTATREDATRKVRIDACSDVVRVSQHTIGHP